MRGNLVFLEWYHLIPLRTPRYWFKGGLRTIFSLKYVFRRHFLRILSHKAPKSTNRWQSYDELSDFSCRRDSVQRATTPGVRRLRSPVRCIHPKETDDVIQNGSLVVHTNWLLSGWTSIPISILMISVQLLTVECWLMLNNLRTKSSAISETKLIVVKDTRKRCVKMTNAFSITLRALLKRQLYIRISCVE